MNAFIRTLFVFLILSLAIQGFSQDTNTQKTERKTQTDATKEEPRPGGLRKITTRSPRDWNFDINIDERALEANIEQAIENAMRSVEGVLEKIEIHIEPIEINLKDMNVDVDPIVVNIRDLNIDIEPIGVDLPDLDIDADMDHHDFDRDDV
ncbi:MAG: hypothetical protein HY015_10115, partial [Bacteroidetes bacterium]|nr:hypothetical protein [Bacteroidota bacterium]